MKSGFSLSQRFFLCFLSAGLVCLSFPNFLSRTLTPPTAFLGWVALVPFFVALDKTSPRQGALLGCFFGFVQFGGILYWIAFLEAAQYLSGLAWAVLVFYLSLYFLLFGWIYRWLSLRLSLGAWMSPFLWVALEYVRGSRPWGGFPWGEIGYSQAPYPVLLTLTSWTGIYGLTFLMVWFNASMAQWLMAVAQGKSMENSRNRRLSERVFFTAPFFVLAAVLIGGGIELKTAPLEKAGTVALLQPSIDQDVKWSKENQKATYDKLEGLVREAMGKRKPNLIVWPETAAPSFLLWTPSDLMRVVSMVRRSEVPHLVGCLDAQKKSDAKTHCYNAAVQFAADGKPTGIYHKRHLVPFGEFVPFQKYISFLGPVVGDLGDFDPGEEYEKFQAGGFSYTPMICYEVIFPGDVCQAFGTHADVLVNISNDAWYGRTASAYQHVMMAVVRAAEERKPLLRAANTGISLATDPFGRIQCSTRLFEETHLDADVFLTSSPPTLFARWGNWFPRLCWWVLVLGGVWAIRKSISAKSPSFQDRTHGT